MSDGGATRGAQTVYRAISILETFRADRAVLTLAEICELVDLTPPTAHRLLRALQSHDLVVFDETTRGYSLGSGVVRLASVLLNRDDVLPITQPRLHRLREITGETVALHWRVRNHRVCLLEYVSTQPIRMASGLGNSYPLVSGAAGKAILAFMPDDEMNRTIEEERRGGGRVNAAALRRDLDEIRGLRYAVSFGETVPGASAVATPILNSAGRAIAALNITGPADRLTQASIKETVPKLLETAREIMEQLGHDGSLTSALAPVD
ncbi:MAG TPA: IclR family transcriptional regulator [Solirubrobacterales bacterium]|nr:IclR family transcriptional regulator [Solirubrobacterales bacterium]